MSNYFADCFISYNHRDADQAAALSDFFRGAGVRSFIYQHDLLPAKEIKKAVREAIEECDAFLPLMSPDSINSAWVKREISFARELHRLRGQEYPIVVPIYTRGTKPCRLWLRGFESGWPNATTFDLSDFRGISLDNPDTDSVGQIVRLLKPQMRYYGERRGDIDEAPNETWTLYESLFPNASERDPPYVIKQWVNECVTLGPESDWTELFTTMTVAGRVVGFAYLSAHKESGYIFGNYFGMDLYWRKYERAEYLLDDLEKYAMRRLPNAKGILFEVEPYDGSLVTRLLRRLKSHRERPRRTFKLTRQEKETIRSIRRLGLYLDHPKKRSKMFVNATDGQTMRYRQPAMSYPFKQSKEVELILMMRPLSSEAERGEYSAQEIMDFLYDELFGDAYEEESEGGLKGYRSYLERLKARVLARNGEKLRLRAALGKVERKLLDELKRASIVVPL